MHRILLSAILLHSMGWGGVPQVPKSSSDLKFIEILTPSSSDNRNKKRIIRAVPKDVLESEVIPQETEVFLLREQLQHADDNAEFYLGSGAEGDTFAVVFTPENIGVVSNVFVQWYSAGSVIAFGADYNSDAATLSPNGECSGIDHGDFTGSPIGGIRTTPTLNVIEGYVSDWTRPLDIGNNFMVDYDSTGPKPFVIAYVKQDSNPKVLADQTFDQDTLTYTWLGGPWTDGEWGRYHPEVELMMMVEIEYPHPPHHYVWIVNLPDTYITPESFQVMCEIGNGDPRTEEDTLKYYYRLNSGDVVDGYMTPVDTDSWGWGMFSFNIEGDFQIGDEIEYWARAWNQYGLVMESQFSYFTILEPQNPTANLLIVSDYYPNELRPFEHICELNDISYEFWDVQSHHGIDSSVINFGWDQIIVYGWSNRSIPLVQGDPDPGYSHFLNTGGDLVLIDESWLNGYSPSFTFQPGDFAYDYFGLAGATNIRWSSYNEILGDSLFIGTGLTEMDSPFMDEPLIVHSADFGIHLASDPLTPGTADPIFFGLNDSLIYGVINDTEAYRTAYLSFRADAALSFGPDSLIDWENSHFNSLASGMMEWLGVTSDIYESSIPRSLSLYSIYPNPFNNQTTIDYELLKKTDVSLNIYDLLGRLVVFFDFPGQDEGQHKITWDASDISSGVYFIQMSTFEGIETKKVVILK